MDGLFDHLTDDDMAPKYRKIDPRMWKDERFRTLPDVEKLVAIYVITAQSNRIGIFNFSPSLACEDLGMKTDTFLKRFGNVVATLKWHWDSTARVVYLPTWWRYNKPDNANVLMGNLDDIDDLPQTYLLPMFCDNTKYLEGTHPVTFKERIAIRLANVVLQEQEQEQEQNQKQNQHKNGDGRKDQKQTASASFDAFWNAYPRHEKKADAHKAWLALNPNDALVEKILAAIASYKNTDQWRKDGGKFIPYPTTWIHGRRWEDDCDLFRPAGQQADGTRTYTIEEARAMGIDV